MVSAAALAYIEAYTFLKQNYRETISTLKQEDVNWTLINELTEAAEQCVERISRLLMEKIPTADIQACRDLVASCAQLHEQMYKILRERKQDLGREMHQQSKVGKALNAYRPNQEQTPQFQDRHL